MSGWGRKYGVATLLLSVGLACTQLLGDEQQNTLAPRQGPSFGPAPSGTAPLQPGEPGICASGQMRCEGALLQTCSDDRSSWVTVQRCGAAALCQADPATCLSATCAPDEMTCAGAVLQRCNADRTGWDVFNTCLSPAHCNANLRQCLGEPCSPGDRRCDRSQSDQSPVLEVCREDRSGWDQLDACVTRELCDQTLTSVGLGGLVLGSDGMFVPSASDPSTVVQCNLPACAVGETRCEGATLQFCSEGRTGWITAEECASSALCESSRNNLGSGGTPQCLPPACAPGEHRCSEGGLLQVCSEDRSGFVDEEQCIGAPFCNAALANQGQSGCTDAPCEAGLMQCNGAQIEVCRADRTGLDPVGLPCESAALCNAEDAANAFCEEPLCRRGATSGDEFRCEGAQLQRCNESLTDYDTLQTCVTAALCDASQRFNGCRPPVCQPGQFSCSNGFLQTCNADQTGFDNVENCGSQAQCDANAGRCADPCEPGSTRCNASNGDLERCNDRLTGWQPIADCPNAQLCDAQNARCRICVPDEFSCADGQLRQCDREGRSFARVNIPPECALNPSGGGGIRACQGNTVVVNPCPLGCQQPENRCRECNPEQTQCVGNGQFRTCGNNGFYGAPTSCSDGNFCNGTETCQNNQCVDGPDPNCGAFGCQLNRCNNCNGGQCASGTQFQTCDNGLLSAARNCPTGQVCQAGGNCRFPCGPGACNDGNPCTQDVCNPNTGCSNPPVNNGTSCSDGNACNGAETCQGGQCQRGPALNCNDNNPCTNDTCNPAVGCQRTNVANGTSCSDGNACDGLEICQNGTCANGTPLNCNDNNACTNDSCNPATGCQRTNVPNRSQCVNGDIQSCTNGVASTLECGANGCNAGATACNACSANTPATCVGGQLRRCVNGQLVTSACAAGQVCQNGACVTSAPPVVCTANALFCQGGALRQCNATGTASTAAARCVANGNGRTSRSCNGNTVVTETCTVASGSCQLPNCSEALGCDAAPRPAPRGQICLLAPSIAQGRCDGTSTTCVECIEGDDAPCAGNGGRCVGTRCVFNPR